jgi:hypothetical protein
MFVLCWANLHKGYGIPTHNLIAIFHRLTIISTTSTTIYLKAILPCIESAASLRLYCSIMYVKIVEPKHDHARSL